MKSIVVATSSCCLQGIGITLPFELELLRMHVKVDTVEFTDGKNINSERLVEIMTNPLHPNVLASSTPASDHEIANLFAQLVQRGYTHVFVSCISSQFSDSLAIIERVRPRFADKLSICVYDTKSINIAEGALVYEAGVMLSQGKSFDDIVARLDTLRANSDVYFTVSRLDYLIRNKKISAPAGWVANLLDIKPVIHLDETGTLVVSDKVRKTQKAITHIAEHLAKRAGLRASALFIADTAMSRDMSVALQQLLAQQYGLTQVPIVDLSAISIANHGPFAVGLGAFYGDIPLLYHRLHNAA